jgi:adenosylmethionine-8-amino-7-oxononanoate aminotransferase
LQGAGGMRLYSPALLAHLRRWSRQYGVLLIADEIAAGIGRLGAMLATHLVPGAPAEILPDFAVVSKGLTAGFLPLSAVLTTDDIYALFEGDSPARAFLHSNTWTGNALGVAAALAALDVYAGDDILATVRARGAVLREEMAAMVARRPFLRGLRGLGMMAAIDLATLDGQTLDASLRTGRRVYREAVTRGALLRPLGDSMYIFPPLDTAPEDLRAMVTVLGESIDAVLKSPPAK